MLGITCGAAGGTLTGAGGGGGGKAGFLNILIFLIFEGFGGGGGGGAGKEGSGGGAIFFVCENPATESSSRKVIMQIFICFIDDILQLDAPHENFHKKIKRFLLHLQNKKTPLHGASSQLV